MSNNLHIAVDIGGTFTDTVLSDGYNSILATAKTPTTSRNPVEGAAEGVFDVLRQSQKSLGDITRFIHGTTLATNTLIEKRGAKTACITTEGFRDILEIGYERRYSQYDINIEKPDLLVPRRHCFTIAERICASGEILHPLDTSNLDQLLSRLDHEEIGAVAICLLHAYANPIHEQQLGELIKQRRPELVVSCSNEVSPEAREFDRLCTTIANAYIQPMMASYLGDFEASFLSQGLKCPILMMTASGGMTTMETASRLPIRLVESGPAGGAILAATIAKDNNIENVLSFDMGGTTAKLCLIDDFRPQNARQFEIARAQRFIKGSGIPVRIPVIEMIEIGAGGGSIASVDQLGRLSVGPKSAGSEPGPAAFTRGGTQPTVTDADIALGFIDPAEFAEGRVVIEIDAANQALQRDIGEPLKIEPIEAAEGVSQIVDENMASASRMHAVESGKDLSTRTMIAFGGNGPLHATRVARRSGVSRILIPRDPGVGSAVGFLFAPISYELIRSHYTTLNDFNFSSVNDMIEEMIDESKRYRAIRKYIGTRFLPRIPGRIIRDISIRIYAISWSRP